MEEAIVTGMGRERKTIEAVVLIRSMNENRPLREEGSVLLRPADEGPRIEME